ncbi:MAG: protein-L-isoaspartate(D-aspartate) O-methyltransferase [Rhodocyclaceae bacterium]|nr:protein-L-isoaspartate(D-aspartate) O-methyltransferase [Rhodocyclaceae bacterium]
MPETVFHKPGAPEAARTAGKVVDIGRVEQSRILAERRRMRTDSNRDLDFLLDEIREEVRATRHLTGRPALEERVMEALRQVPRHEFVPDELQYGAYANHPLPIGHGQTISQPYIVALMTDLIHPRLDDVVLEIGTGSGYQAAILSRLVKRVYSIEIVAELAREAGERLQRLGYDNVEVRAGNGQLGWPQHAPYDAILVAAAASRIPPALIEQLKPGGTLVIPVGAQHAAQNLLVLRKTASGRVEETNVLPVAFVPLTGTPED